MQSGTKFIVITSINGRTPAIHRFAAMSEWQVVVVGDKKSRDVQPSDGVTFLSVDDQKRLGYRLAELAPYNHYARKNIGYLYAIRSGAEVIYDTDDDNLPYDDWGWDDFYSERRLTNGRKFLNVYRHFSPEPIWPRGFPIDQIRVESPLSEEATEKMPVGVWQGLADLDPDVDAIYRLLFGKAVTFQKRPSVHLPQGTYCPSNSQNTLWNRKFFNLLYLPFTASFRFTDILRGYIAQRLLWTAANYLGFCRATVYQERNIHDLMKDFEDEIQCYLGTRSVIDILDQVDLSGVMAHDLLEIYERLVERRIVRPEEIDLVQAWLADAEHHHMAASKNG